MLRMNSYAHEKMVRPSDGDSLIQGELKRGTFPDERLGKRLAAVLEQRKRPAGDLV